MTSEGVNALLRMLANLPGKAKDEEGKPIPKLIECKLKILNIESSFATKEAVAVLDQIKKIKPDLKIKLGGIIGNYELKGPDIERLYFESANYEARSQKKKKQRKNFGLFVVTLPDKVVKNGKCISGRNFKDIFFYKFNRLKKQTASNRILNFFKLIKKNYHLWQILFKFVPKNLSMKYFNFSHFYILHNILSLADYDPTI